MLAANKNGNAADINALFKYYTHGVCVCVCEMVHFDLQNIRKLGNFRGSHLSYDRIFCDTKSNTVVHIATVAYCIFTSNHLFNLFDDGKNHHRIPIINFHCC